MTTQSTIASTIGATVAERETVAGQLAQFSSADLGLTAYVAPWRKGELFAVHLRDDDAGEFIGLVKILATLAQAEAYALECVRES